MPGYMRLCLLNSIRPDRVPQRGVLPRPLPPALCNIPQFIPLHPMVEPPHPPQIILMQEVTTHVSDPNSIMYLTTVM